MRSFYMKARNTFQILVVAFYLFLYQISFGQITINKMSSLTNAQVAIAMVDSLMGNGVTFSNATFQGVRLSGGSGGYQIGYFATATTTQSGMDFSQGVVLSTGDVAQIPLTLGVDPGSVAQMSKAYTSCTTGEVRQGGSCPTYINDLDILAGTVNYYNAAVLEFDFVPTGDSICFRYVFGSEEYTDNSGSINYQCSTYNDKFGFLISGPGITGGAGYTNNAKNIARLSNGSEVGINSVNNGVVGSSGGSPSAANCTACNPDWVHNSPSPEYLGFIDGTQLNGNTKALYAAQGGLTPGQTYHIKLLILDANDAAYDAVVYIEAGSFTSPLPTLAVSATPATICQGSTSTLQATISYCVPNYTYTWSDGITTIQTTSNTSSTTDQVVVTPATTTTYYVTVTDQGTPATTATSSVVVTVNPAPVASAGSNSPICTGSILNLSSSGGSTYSWSGPNGFASSSQNPTIASITAAAAGTYTVTVTGSNGCTATASTTVVINTSPTVSAGSNTPVCTGTTLNLTSGGGSTYSWSGPNGFTSSSQNPSIASITAAAAGTYTVTVNAANGCTATATTVVSVNTSPTPTINSNTPVCSGNTLNLTSGGGSTYSWSGPNSFTSTSQNPGITGVATAAGGTYTVTVTAGNGCTASASTSVTINSSPSINAGIDLTIPNGTSTTLNTTPSGGSGSYTYAWSPAGSLTNSTVQNPTTTNLSSTTTYTVTITDQVTGCTGSDQIVVNVSGGVLDVNSISVTPSSICNGGSAQLQATATGGSGTYTYAWSPATYLSSTTIYNPIASPPNTATYTVSVNDGFNTVTDQVTITVYPLPTPSAGSNSPICTGNAINLNSSGGTTYSWGGPNGFSSSSQNPSISAASLAESGVYTVTVTDANTCSATAQVSVTVNTTPVAGAGNDGPACTGGTVNLNSSGGTSYSWSGPNSFSSTSQNPNVTNVTPADTGTYIVTVTSSGCTATAQTTIALYAVPSAVSGSNSPLCEGDTLKLTSGGGISYSWSGPNAFSDASQNPFIANITLADTGTYTVTVTGTGGCTATSQVAVVVNALPVPIAGSNAPLCSGNMLNLTASGGTTYNWSGPNSFSSTLQNPSIVSATPLATGIYNLTVTGAGGCSASTYITIAVDSTPVAMAANNGPVCPGSTINLTSGTGVSYSWSGPNSFSSTQQNPNITSVTSSDAGTYTVTVTGSSGCTNTASVSVTVNPQAAANAGNDASICNGSSTQLTASGGISYQWSPSSGLSSTSVSNPTANPTSTTTYTVLVTNSQGCTGNDDVTITVNPLPTADAGSDTSICNGSLTQLNASGGTSYSWSPSSGLNSSTSANPNASPSSTTTYTVVVSNSQGCTDSDNVTVTVNPLPNANTGADQQVCEGSSVTLTASGGGTYSWNTGGTTATINETPASTTTYSVTVTDANGCSASDEVQVTVNPIPVVTISSNPTGIAYVGQIITFTASPDGYSTYTFYIDGSQVQNGVLNYYQTISLTNGQVVTVTANDNGCTSNAVASVDIIIKEISNAFTPDGDGKNDVFAKGLDLTILNRWEQTLYQGTDGWDGKFNGTLVSPGTYFYIIRLPDLTGEVKILKGSVTLVSK